MADLNGIIAEINQANLNFNGSFDIVRKKYIKQLSKYTGRNTICYYSDFLNSPKHPDIGINDKDMSGFMTMVHGVDKTKGLDLVLHTPGGGVSAAEAIGDYLRKSFGNDIRMIIPHMAMSAGTLLSCISKEIIMGKHSSIGPFDPQLGGISAYEVVRQFEEARSEIIENPNSALFWQQIIGKYSPLFSRECARAIELSAEVSRKWLQTGNMLDSNEKIERVISFLNSNEHTKEHIRHIDIERAKELGLKVVELESDNKLQELVLSVHHAYMACFQNINRVKLIENDHGVSFIISGESQQL